MLALREEKTTRNFAPVGIREFLRARRKHTEFDFRRLTCVSCLWQATPKGREFIPWYCSFLPTGLSVPCLCSNHLGFRPGRSPSRSLRVLRSSRTKGTLDALREKRSLPPAGLNFVLALPLHLSKKDRGTLAQGSILPPRRVCVAPKAWDTGIPKFHLPVAQAF